MIHYSGFAPDAGRIDIRILEALHMLEKLISYLSQELDIPADSITRDTTFESLHLDSLDTVEMLMDLEEELGVDLELEEKLNTIGELADFIESKLD